MRAPHTGERPRKHPRAIGCLQRCATDILLFGVKAHGILAALSLHSDSVTCIGTASLRLGAGCSLLCLSFSLLRLLYLVSFRITSSYHGVRTARGSAARADAQEEQAAEAAPGLGIGFLSITRRFSRFVLIFATLRPSSIEGSAYLIIRSYFLVDLNLITAGDFAAFFPSNHCIGQGYYGCIRRGV
ncbi:hypothetical protein BU16DRAFT_30728 [Lophium mytilinum]|uniref:Uncharacterized protein n=1 Tax=Lophium mytilinum TaxID=390894 RepID=A0A6A6REP0_9PEZI|nr:hypothetical protein BU16DRAFT_30728 [Lophium mytilinum]